MPAPITRPRNARSRLAALRQDALLFANEIMASRSGIPPLLDGVNGEAKHLPPLLDGVNGEAKRVPPLLDGVNGEAKHVPPLLDGVNGEAPAKEHPGRDGQGRFTKGNRGGTGNPFHRRMAAFRRAVCQAVSLEDLKIVACVLVSMAKDGDLAAAKLLWLYTIGRPGPAADPDTLDQHEWQLFQQTPTDGEQLQAVIGSMPIELANRLLRIARPAIIRDQERQLGRGLAKQELRLNERKARRLARQQARQRAEPAALPEPPAASADQKDQMLDAVR
jgi:hypothetical protein